LLTNAENVLYSFGSSDLAGPKGTPTQSGSTLFGIAGNIFSLNLNTNSANLVYAFGGPPDAAPGAYGSLTLVGSCLYGMSGGGGTAGDGAIFSYSLSTGVETVLHSFAGSPDGDLPFGSLTRSGSVLYGMTLGGGDTDAGTIFSIDTSDDSYSVLFSFTSGVTGGGPMGDVLVDGPMLYGMTIGDVFAFDTDTDSLTVLHKFQGPDGRNPEGDLALVGNTLYGMTTEGGTNNDGVIFSITIPEPASVSLICAVAAVSLMRRPRKILM